MYENWILITGGSRGIGKALVERFARNGRPVVFTYLASGDAASELERSMEGVARVKGLRCDGRDHSAMMAAAKDLTEQHGAPSAIINNSGITRDALFLNMTQAQWDEVLQANLTSAFNTTKAFLPALIDSGRGSVIQITSVSGLKGNAGQANYSATKAGLIGFTRSLALEIARFNVRVNAIAPGFIETEMIQELPAHEAKTLMKAIPMRRMGKADEVAALAEFLVSDVAGYITGQTFVIDGGLSC